MFVAQQYHENQLQTVLHNIVISVRFSIVIPVLQKSYFEISQKQLKINRFQTSFKKPLRYENPLEQCLYIIVFSRCWSYNLWY